MPVKMAHLPETQADFHRLNHRLSLLLAFRKRMERRRMWLNPRAEEALDREERACVARLGRLLPRVEVREG